MAIIKKEIFGKVYSFEYPDSLAVYLNPSIRLYPTIRSLSSDVQIRFDNIPWEEELIGNNPSSFIKAKDIIITRFPECNVAWRFQKDENQLECIVDIPIARKDAKTFFFKFLSKEFSTDVEFFEQVLHEFVLVPSAYFFDDLAVIHSAAVAVHERVVLLAGTGGTGKSSAILALRKMRGISFVSDDITVLSHTGVVYPNLAWPKIYGYNLSSYISKHELLKGRGVVDKFHFDVKLKYNPRSVRRKMHPDALYGLVENRGLPIHKIIYLFRGNGQDMFVRDLNSPMAIEMAIQVMKAEYAVFHNFLQWDKYNSLASGMNPVLDVDKVFDQWRNNLRAALRRAEIKLLHIPVRVKHVEYLEFIRTYLTH